MSVLSYENIDLIIKFTLFVEIIISLVREIINAFHFKYRNLQHKCSLGQKNRCPF